LIALSGSTLMGCAVVMEAYDSVVMVSLSVILQIFVWMESRRQSLSYFFVHRQLEQHIRIKEEAADEANAIEMRHMIANVAHDLKTVS